MTGLWHIVSLSKGYGTIANFRRLWTKHYICSIVSFYHTALTADVMYSSIRNGELLRTLIQVTYF
jgi:hypothetical protein